jgi:hypothetical protein
MADHKAGETALSGPGGADMRRMPRGAGVSPNDLADALIRIFGREAIQQARDNAASNAQAGDTASEKMWLGVIELLERKLPAPRGVRSR